MSPSNQVVCSATTNIIVVLHTQLVELFMQTFVASHKACLVGAAADEEIVYTIIDIRLIDNWGFRKIDGSRKNSQRTKDIQITKCHILRHTSAHGKSTQSTCMFVLNHTVMRLYERNNTLQQLTLHQRESQFSVFRMTSGDHLIVRETYYHLTSLSFCYDIVKNEVSAPMHHPCLREVTGTTHQIKHWILLLRIIVGWGIDHHIAQPICHF